MKIELGTDSGDYELLREAVQLAPNGYYLATEIGVREGGSTQMIMEELAAKKFRGMLTLIDHYGGMPQWHSDTECVVLDYTNEMRNRAMSSIYQLANHHKINFQFFNLADDDFFAFFPDGVPIYSGGVRMLVNEYCFAHLDGPHRVELVEKEAAFFAPRMVRGGVIVTDDIQLFNFKQFTKFAKTIGLELVKKGGLKAVFQKQ
jgi:hypothetical protein